jgi:hypothetical protein
VSDDAESSVRWRGAEAKGGVGSGDGVGCFATGHRLPVVPATPVRDCSSLPLRSALAVIAVTPRAALDNRHTMAVNARLSSGEALSFALRRGPTDGLDEVLEDAKTPLRVRYDNELSSPGFDDSLQTQQLVAAF